MISSNIRIPEELWEKLKKISEKEERSINSQLIYLSKNISKNMKKKTLPKTSRVIFSFYQPLLCADKVFQYLLYQIFSLLYNLTYTYFHKNHYYHFPRPKPSK